MVCTLPFLPPFVCPFVDVARVSLPFVHVAQAEKLGDKRLSEQATKRLKDQAAAAVRRRERALYEAREAAVRGRERETQHIAAATFYRDHHLFCKLAISREGGKRGGLVPERGWLIQKAKAKAKVHAIDGVRKGAVGSLLSVESNLINLLLRVVD